MASDYLPQVSFIITKFQLSLFLGSHNLFGYVKISQIMLH